MKSLKMEIESIKELLRGAYHERENAEVSHQWRLNVMDHIRNIGAIKTTPAYITLFEQSFWRLAPAACFLIIVLAVLLLKFDFTPEYEVFASLINDVELVDLEQLLGI
ncbi:MAG TPA: hypothetical protein VMW42_08740 [Desulfatiglandales bacterium]|nr:hypothetical protein [Desulfatiglandales bacterium]